MKVAPYASAQKKKEVEYNSALGCMALLMERVCHAPPLTLPSPPALESKPLTFIPPKLRRLSSQSLSSNHSYISPLDDPLNSRTYALALESCYCSRYGKQVHAQALKNGFRGHEFVETKLLQMYAKCGSLDDAVRMFDEMPERNLYSWTAILGAFVDHGLFEDGFFMFLEMQVVDLELKFFVFPLLSKICVGLCSVELGRQFHGIVVKSEVDNNIYVGNALMDMYGKCGSLDDARRVLGYMEERDLVSWNTMIAACYANGKVDEALLFMQKMWVEDNLSPNLVSWSAVIGGCSQNGLDEEAIEILGRMQAAGIEPNARTLASVLPACARLEKLRLGKELHGFIVRRGFMGNQIVVNGILDVYRRCNEVNSAVNIFSKFSVQNAASYNTMIVAYCEAGDISNARRLFDQMESNGLEKDVISWNSMISGYVDNSMFREALKMFINLLMHDGIATNSFTLGSVLTACTNMGLIRLGKEIHLHAIVRGLQSNPFVGGSLVEMYSKCQDLKSARTSFNEVSERDMATWNAMISGYSHCNQIENIQVSLQEMREEGFEPNVYTWNGIIAGHVENGCHELALNMFSQMHTSNLQPDNYTIATILTSCSRLATLERGKQVHAHLIRFDYKSDFHIGAALVDMYAKCGNIKYSCLAYNRISTQNLVTQNSMLTAYAIHGYGEEGIAFFRKMLRDGYTPDSVTFLSVLSSCVHAGSVEAGKEFFKLLRPYNVNPTLKHFTCMVDLLSRAGEINEAYKFIREMPLQPDSVIWSAFLGGCVLSGNVDLGEVAAKRLIELEPDKTANYVLLANLYAYAGKWRELSKTRQIIKNKHMNKNPGCSWIENSDEIHIFVSGDRSHKKHNEINDTLNNLRIHMSLVKELRQ
ncbi:pentatricopeptide repeat-containing protein At3g16610-like [Apium graveolens]|uniref:pentatricopeptide repeat-containing protein At3g16610-like n=1 Tax=Apium graveolens TaxID=4045 RepID=UPI003D796AB3